MSKQVTSKPRVPEGWRPTRREHGGFRQVRRDAEKGLVFKGQEKDEVVKLVVRQHPLFLLRPGLPALAVLFALLVVSILLFRFPEFRPLWSTLDILLVILLIISLAYFFWKDFLIWWVTIDIITNKRILSCRGFLQPSRTSITLDK